MSKCYAGIGARELSKSLDTEFADIAKRLAALGLSLRSGGAQGADSAFERGCDSIPGEKEIFLPWKGFNGSKSTLVLEDTIPKPVTNILMELYPHWEVATNAVRRLHARNVYQILGHDLTNHSAFVVCWTDRNYNDPSAIGGTLFGIKLAERNEIPVYNFYVRGDRERFYKMLEIYENEGIDTSDIPETV